MDDVANNAAVGRSASSRGPAGNSAPRMKKDGKSLSKNLLYTPLQEYQDARRRNNVGNINITTIVSPLTTVRNISSALSSSSTTKNYTTNINRYNNVPKALQEPTFVEFMQAVSYDFHRNHAKASDAKNNGSRPLNLGEMDTRIKSRAVTLIGGGINKKSSTSAAASSTTSRSRRRRRSRRKRSWEQVKSLLHRQPQVESTQWISTFVRKMNHRWNHYIQKLVSSDINDNSRNHSLSERNPSGKTDELEEEDILIGRRIVSLLQPSLRKEKTGRGSKKRLSSSFCSVEIVGAHVKIDECPSRIQWIGLYGVVVGETTNTLHVAGYSFCKPNEGQKRQTPLGLYSPQMTDVVDGELKFAFDEDRHDPTSALRVVRVFVLPKRHTKISVIVPVTLKKQDVEDHNKEYIEDGRQQSIVRFVGKHVSVPVVF